MSPSLATLIFSEGQQVAYVLTEAGTATCAHQGVIVLKSGQSKLTVKKKKVLVDGDMDSASFAAPPTCMTVPASAPAPVSVKCTNVAKVTNKGTSSKLKVEGKCVLLSDVSGTTNGTVANVAFPTWSVQNAGQTNLKTQ